MRKVLASAMGVAAAFALAFGAGPAGADNEYAGITYGTLSERLGSAPKIAGRVGDALPTNDCLVVSNRRPSFADSSGNRNSNLVVYLNCNDPMKGYSVASEQGKKALELKSTAKALNSQYKKSLEDGTTFACLPGAKDDDGATTRWCVRMCEQSGMCSAELSSALGL